MISTDLFTKEFEDFRPQLKSYVLRMTASTEDTEDIIQETYLKAHKNLSSFKKKSSLKTWVFAIASNLARDLLRNQKRWSENVTDICRNKALNNRAFLEEMMGIRMTSDQGNFEIKEHITFCFGCVSKSLPIEQQVTLLLKEVYGFRVKEIAQIIDNTEAMVKYYLHVSRKRMIDIFDNRCSLINKEGVCHQCTELNGIFNPEQKAQEEIVKIEMAREADSKSSEELFDLRTDIVKGIDPYESDAAKLQLRHLKHNKGVMDEYLKKSK